MPPATETPPASFIDPAKDDLPGWAEALLARALGAGALAFLVDGATIELMRDRGTPAWHQRRFGDAWSLGVTRRANFEMSDLLHVQRASDTVNVAFRRVRRPAIDRWTGRL